MKKILLIISICILLTACETEKKTFTVETTEKNTGEKVVENMTYKQITAEEAKKIIDTEEDVVILDVREQDEFVSGHIPGATLIPYTEIDNKAEEMIPDKNQQILVYCRSGRRSKIASESLVNLGYTNVIEFGGIIDWSYEIEK